VNVAVFFLWQPTFGSIAAQDEFLYERAAIPCELTQGHPLTEAELIRGQCDEAPAGAMPFPGKNVWLAVLTSMFLHANILHLAGNMWFLWIFGDNVEDRLGHVLFALIYILGGVAGTAGFAFMRPEETFPLIGASGAIAGVLGAYLVMFPTRPVLALVGFLALPVPALIFIGLWFVLQFGVVDPGVAWEAHVFGFLAGLALALLLRPFGRKRR
jgi:membrane associated rhomboid family serine protease